MRFRKGKTLVKHYHKQASSAISTGDLLMWSATSGGLLVAATTGSTKHVGVALEGSVSGDANYASTSKISVEIPRGLGCEIEAEVTGSLATTDVGKAFDLAAAGTVNKAKSTHKVMLCKKYLATDKGVFSLNSLEDYQGTTW